MLPGAWPSAWRAAWAAVLLGALLAGPRPADAQPRTGLPEAASQGMARAAGRGRGAMATVPPAAPAHPGPPASPPPPARPAAPAVSVTATPLATGLAPGAALGALAMDAASGQAWVLQGSRGLLGRVGPDGTPAAPLAVPRGSDQLALDPPRSQALVADGPQLHFIDLPPAPDPIGAVATADLPPTTPPSATPTGPAPAYPRPATDPTTLALPGPIRALAVDPDHAQALVLTHGRTQLHVIDTAGRRLLASQAVPQAEQLALDPVRGLAFVLAGADQLLVWDRARAAVIAQHRLPFRADRLAFAPGTTTDAATGTDAATATTAGLATGTDRRPDQLLFTTGRAPWQLWQLAIDDLLAASPPAARAWRVHDLPAAASALAIDPEQALAVLSLPGADQVGVLDLTRSHWYGGYLSLQRPGALALAPQQGDALVLDDKQGLLRFALPQPLPELQALTPDAAPAGGPALPLTLTGRGFTRASQVHFGPLALTTRYQSPTRLTAEVPASALAYPGSMQVSVTNPAPAGGRSELAFTVAAYPPELRAVMPATLVANGQPASVQLQGRQFAAGAHVLAGDQTLAADWQAATALRIQLPAELLQTPGQLPLVVVNPDGQASAPLVLVLAAPPPALTLARVVPAAAGPGATVRLEGSGFDPAAAPQLTLAGQPVPIAAVTPTTLTVIVPADAGSGAFVLQQGPLRAAGPWFEVVRAQDFALTASPGQLVLAPGGRTRVTLQLVSRGTRAFDGLVSLAVVGLPAGLTAELSHPLLGLAQPVTLTISAAAGDAGALPAAQALAIEARATLAGVPLVRRALLQIQRAPADGARRVQGRFVTPDGQGIAGVRVYADLGDDAGLLAAPHTVSDAGGNFALAGLPAGAVTLRMDATPAHPQYPIWPLSITVPAEGVLNLADWTLPPPPLEAHYTPIANAAGDQTVTDPRYPGLAVTLPAGVTITGWDGVPKDRIAVSRLAPDQLPVSPPPFAMKEAYQLHFGSAMGGIPSAPIPVTLPNVAELAPGEQAEIWWFDGSPMGGSGQWQLAGLGTVSADGRSVASHPGVGIPRFCGVCGLVSLNCPPPAIPAQPPPMADPPACGNPIDLYTGQALATAGGLACGGRHPIDLGLRYHPVDAFNNRAGTLASTGYGWVLDVDLAFLPFAGPQKRLVLPGSRFVHFIDDGSGQYRAPDDPRFAGAVASELPDSHADRPRWQIRLADGSRWTFDAFPGIAGLIRGGPPLFLTAITDAAGVTQTLTRRPDGRLTALGTPERSLRLQYGAHGFAEQISDDAGRRLQLSYTAQGRIATLTDADGRATGYAYAGEDEIAPDAACGPQPDAGQRLTRIDYPGKATPTVNHYGVGRRVLRQHSGRGTTQFAYQLSGACVTHIERPGQLCTGAACPTVDSWQHHQAGWRIHGGRVLATTVTLPDGTTQTTRFNARGLPIETIDAAGQRHTRDYDARGQLVGQTDALGRRWRYALDEQGLPTAITDPLGRVTELSHDPRWGRPTTLTRRDDGGRRQVSQWHYDAQHGQLRRQQDPAGRVTTFDYDDTGQLTTLTLPGDRTWTFGYTAAGDVARVTDPLGQRTTVATDAVGRTIGWTNPLGYTRQLGYAGSEAPVSATDALGRTVSFGQDAAGRLASVTNAAGVTLDSRTYDDGDRLLTQTDALGAATQLTYDDAGRQVARTDRNGHLTRLTYDAIGQLATIDDGDSRQTLRHDAAGRLIERHQTDADGTTHTLHWQYDAADRVTLVDSRTPGLTTRVRYGYDALDRRIERGVTINGGPEQVTRYAWNAAGQLTALDAHGQRTTFGYDDAGRLIRQILPNGLVKTLAWDAADQLIRLTYTTGSDSGSTSDGSDSTSDGSDGSISSSSGQVLEDLRYTYDAAGRRIRKQSLGPSVHDTPMTATYDAANRMQTLVMKPRTAQARRYPLTHDAAGQLREKVRVDADGQPTTGSSAARTRFDWNARGQLVQLVSTAGDGETAMTVTSSYRYDPLGRRIERVVERRDGGSSSTATRQTVRYVYDGLQAIAEVREGADGEPAGSASTTTIHLLTGLQLDELIARQSTGSLQVALTDALGSVLAITDATQQMTASWAYSPYGETVAIGPSLEQPTQYTGREHDEGASAAPDGMPQVYYYRARYYLPAAKRFVSEDPIGIAGGINVYGYVNGNPASYVDPLGLDATRWGNVSGGRRLWDGPTNGNWGGKCWSGGKYSCGGNSPGDAPPTDSGDACYQRHDDCYMACGSNQRCISSCDKKLIDELLQLSNDPRQWPQPPRPGTAGDSRRYRDAALRYFR